MTRLALVHAVARASDALATDHASPVPGGQLTWVVRSDLAALVSLLPESSEVDLFADQEAAAALSLRHHELLTRLSARIDLAPVRIGTACSDQSAVERMLEAEALTFAAALDRIGGKQEYVVKLTPAAAPASPEAPAPAVGGRSYLQRLAARADEQKARREEARASATAAFEQLRAAAEAHAFMPPRRHAAADGEKRLIDAALLVRRDAADRFAAAVETAQGDAASAGFHLSVRGPLPPYSFVGSEA